MRNEKTRENNEGWEKGEKIMRTEKERENHEARETKTKHKRRWKGRKYDKEKIKIDKKGMYKIKKE